MNGSAARTHAQVLYSSQLSRRRRRENTLAIELERGKESFFVLTIITVCNAMQS